ncbi:hypothetical protein [uncultured Pseudacidovorax sp.]|uniref:hypothetical protein n=1 Tax=uncultured Pseudacidovorax sp. TaxID=679313 RepID=UPI0025F3C81E|nr:hypothetical protein [uncultured Pseudacidovorax sp.]
MAEVNITKTKLAQIAGTKTSMGSFNRRRTAVLCTAATYAAPAQNDTAGTALVLPKGTRVVLPVSLSCAAGNASSTLSVGIRDAVTKQAIDAAAIVNGASIASATTAQVNNGTKLVNGQDYVMPQDVELYLTFGGAAGLANQAIRVEVDFVAG